MRSFLQTFPSLLLSLAATIAADDPSGGMRAIPLKGEISNVQPMTGIVLWDTSEHNATDAIQLEYAYMRYSDVVSRRGEYDWGVVEKKLDAIAGRAHQAVFRFYYVYPGSPTTVPDYIKHLPDYKETTAKSEKKDTGFPDWSHPELKRFTKEFHTRLAERYDKDPRLAFLQTGFGLWGEYHIYDGPFKPGVTFPDKAFQAEFLKHMAKTFHATPWSISVDAVDDSVSPIDGNAELTSLSFGVFDDSFLCKQHPRENELNWNAMGRKRYLVAPAGGEFSYYNNRDQKLALVADGPNGVSFENAARAFHITYMIGNDQPKHQSMARIRQAGMTCGYKFRIDGFLAGENTARVTVSNTGIAPIYHDAHVAVNGVRADRSLKGLAPGESAVFEIASGGDEPRLTIECDRLVAGQSIGFDADLK